MSAEAAKTPKVKSYVIDASVAIKLFVEEPLSGVVDKLFDSFTSQPFIQLFVPDLFYTECTNILWKYVIRHNMKPATARRNLALLRGLTLEKLETDLIISDALSLALKYEITVYDACYLAAAHSTHATLITADDRLVRKIGDKKHRIITLQEMQMRLASGEKAL